MTYNIQLKIKALILGLFLFLAACHVSTNQNSNLNTSDITTDPCALSGANCTSLSGADLLQIKINNNSPTELSDTHTVLDISGECNDAGYESHFIEWTTFDVASNLNGDSGRITSNPCVRGRFQAQLRVLSPPLTLHRAQLELVGVNLEGQEFRNPAAARKSIDFIARFKTSF